MSLNIKQMLLTPNEWSRPQKAIKQVKAVVIHWVASPKGTAVAVRNFFESRKNGKLDYGSAHYAINLDGSIIQCIPDNEVAYHVGSKTYTKACLDLLGNSPNYYSIGIELTHLDWDGKFTPETYKAAVELTATLCKKYKLNPINNVWTHQEVVGWKDCPRWFVKHPADWEKFKKDVLKAMTPEVKVTPKNGTITVITDILNVRSTPEDNNNKIGEIKKGQMFQVIGIASNGWYQIKFSNGVAYVSGDPKLSQFNENISGVITMQELEQLKKALKIPDSSWAVPEIQQAKKNGIISSDHDPNELVTFGILCTMLNNMMEKLKK